jgi:hypothetical protein
MKMTVKKNTSWFKFSNRLEIERGEGGPDSNTAGEFLAEQTPQ